MGLIRFLLVAIGIFVLAVVIRRLLVPSQPQGKRETASYSPTVRCAHCGINLPRDHAIRSKDGHYYCSVEHRDVNQR